MYKKQNQVYASLFTMLLSPVFTLYAALRNGNRSYVRWVIFIFTIFYASTWDIEGIGDGSRHWQNVYDYYVGLNFGQFVADIGDILLFKNNPNINEDLYIHVISYLVGGILSLPGLFFIVVAMVYGYFFAGSMVKTFEIFPTYRRSILFLGIAIVFIMQLNIQSMNTVRTWTGFWILYYACISYYQSGRRKYIWLMFVPPFVHIGYFIMAIPAWIVVFARNRKLLYSILFFISFTTTIINPGQTINTLNELEVGKEKVHGYYQEEQTTVDQTLEYYEQSRWYVQYQKIGVLGWSIAVMAGLFIVSGRYFRDMNYLEASMFSVGIVTKVLSNSTWFLYAVANRSNAIAISFILAAILLYWQRKYVNEGGIRFSRLEKVVMYTTGITFLPYYVYLLSNTIEYLSALMFAFPFLAWISEDLKITVRELIGYFL